MKRFQTQRWTRFLSVLLFFHTLLAYAAPSELAVGGALLFGLLTLLINGQKALALTVSLALTTVLIEAGLRLSGIDEAIFRPDDMLSKRDFDYDFRRYKKNADLKMDGNEKLDFPPHTLLFLVFIFFHDLLRYNWQLNIFRPELKF